MEAKRPRLYEDIPKAPEISVAPDPDMIPGLPASFFDDNFKPSTVRIVI